VVARIGRWISTVVSADIYFFYFIIAIRARVVAECVANVAEFG
jgi:hypothetical protein